VTSLVVVGEGPVAEQLALGLAARHVPAMPTASDEAADAVGRPRAVVAVAQAGDFEIDSLASHARREHVVELARRTVAAAAAAGARVVGISSAIVCGARPNRPPVADDEIADPDASGTPGLVGALAAFESELVDAADRCGVPLAVLRPAALVGPGVDTFVSRHFEAPRLLVVKDVARTWQFLHVDDLAEAVRVTLAAALTGLLGAGAVRDDGSPDELPAHEVAALAGRRTVTLPASSAFAVAESLHRVGAIPAPPSELAYVVYPWSVAATGLHDAGWQAAWSSAECAAALVENQRGGLTVAGRRVGARDAAALGAAGAAVALLGTAAVWRQARGGR
jgi:nucleoside-diphosphate-sugar epimerase